MSKIYVWIKDPGKAPRHVHISDSLKNLQDTVGGYIEYVHPGASDAVIIVDEEGKLKGYPYNFSMMTHDFVGTAIFAGIDEDGNFTDFPIKDAKQMKRLFPELWRF